MDLILDPDVKAVLEFMQANVTGLVNSVECRVLTLGEVLAVLIERYKNPVVVSLDRYYL